MTVLRVLVLLLIGPSLLMPPRMCVCQLAPGKGIPSGRGRTLPAGPVVAAHAPGSCPTACRGTCRHRATPPPTAGKPVGGQETPPAPGPSDTPHAPNCPALGTAASAKYVETSSIRLDLTAAPGDSPAGRRPPAWDRSPPPDGPASPVAPRYLSFCALLI